jgi:hypothetical protein
MDMPGNDMKPCGPEGCSFSDAQTMADCDALCNTTTCLWDSGECRNILEAVLGKAQLKTLDRSVISRLISGQGGHLTQAMWAGLALGLIVGLGATMAIFYVRRKKRLARLVNRKYGQREPSPRSPGHRARSPPSGRLTSRASVQVHAVRRGGAGRRHCNGRRARLGGRHGRHRPRRRRQHEQQRRPQEGTARLSCRGPGAERDGVRHLVLVQCVRACAWRARGVRAAAVCGAEWVMGRSPRGCGCEVNSDESAADLSRAEDARRQPGAVGTETVHI